MGTATGSAHDGVESHEFASRPATSVSSRQSDRGKVQRCRTAVADDEPANLSLTDAAARQLTNATKSTAQLDTITPRWLIHMLQWVPVEAGIYRLNRVKDPASVTVATPPRDESELPTTYVGYYETPREYFLNTVATIVDIHTRISDLYSSPFDQIAEQIRLTIETVKERQESELINNADYGLLDRRRTLVQRISTLTRSANPGRLRPAHHQGLEGAGVLPRPSPRHCRLRPRVHPPRRPAGHG